MELTRYWRARHNGKDVEVQWTGFQFANGWTLRLLVDGKEEASQRGLAGGGIRLSTGAFAVDFQQELFRNRCTIRAGEAVILEGSQPWNVLALAFVFAVPVLVLLVLISLRG